MLSGLGVWGCEVLEFGVFTGSGVLGFLWRFCSVCGVEDGRVQEV